MPSRTCFIQSLTLTCTSDPQPLPTIEACAHHEIRMAPTDLLIQITQAFQKTPSIARILHGDRRIRQGGRGRRTALFPSSKNGGSIPLESRLELAYAVVLERSADVQEYRTQAIRIALPGGKFAHPDFLIRTIRGTAEVHEVKPSIEHLTLADVQRFALIRAVLAQAGVAFRLIDTRNLPSAVVLEELLQRYSRGHLQAFSKAQIDIAKSLLANKGQCTYREACQLMAQHEVPAQIVDFLSFHQQWCSNPPAANGFGSRGAQ